MKNEEVLDFLMKAAVQNEQVALKKAQDRFVKMHYENAKLINSKGFTNLMGKSYSMSLDEFENLLKSISASSDKGAEIVFDHHEKYTYAQIQRLMSRCGYLIYEYLDSSAMAELGAPAGFYFVLAVKKEHLSS